MTLPAFAVERWRLQHGARSYRSISAADAGAPQQMRSAANPPAAVAAADQWDRQTDGHFFDSTLASS